MPDLRSLSRGMQIAGASAVLLLIDTFLDWQSVDLPGGLGSVGQSAWNGFWGVLLGLLTIAFIAWLAVRLFAVRLPELPVPERTITLVVAAAILLCALIKVLTDDFRAWPAWVGLLLAAGCVAGAWLMSQEPEPARSVPDAPEYTPPAATTTAPRADTAPPPPPASTAPEPPAAGTAPPPSTPQAPPTPASTPPPPPRDDNP